MIGFLTAWSAIRGPNQETPPSSCNSCGGGTSCQGLDNGFKSMMRGGLFTRYFLEEGIRETEAYRAKELGEIVAFAEVVRSRWANLADMRHPSEAETESEFIHPILNHLGWEHLPQQEPGKGRKDIADALLFLNADDKAKARRLHQTADRFRLGVVVVEYEARDTPLDRASGKGEAPSSQLLRYLIRAQ